MEFKKAVWQEILSSGIIIIQMALKIQGIGQDYHRSVDKSEKTGS
jgi:hypothetical protein